MSTEQAPEVASHEAPPSSEMRHDASDGQGGQGGDGRGEHREFRRGRQRECYCRGRNKNCPKCQGTGFLLPNWRENLNAVRQSRGGPGDGQGAPSAGQGGAQGGDGMASASNAGPREGYAPRDNRDNRGGDGRGDNRTDARPEGRENFAPRDNGYPQREGYSNDRGDNNRGGGRNDRQGRWENRRSGGQGGQGGRGGRNNGQIINKGKVCPMCGEFVPNLRQHVLAKHDD